MKLVGSIGPAEILVVLVIALIVMGPARLPDAARSLGKAMAEFRKVSSGLRAEVRDAISEPPTYPRPPETDGTGPAPDGRAEQSPARLPTSPEQSEIVVVREPEPPPSA